VGPAPTRAVPAVRVVGDGVVTSPPPSPPRPEGDARRGPRMRRIDSRAACRMAAALLTPPPAPPPPAPEGDVGPAAAPPDLGLDRTVPGLYTGGGRPEVCTRREARWGDSDSAASVVAGAEGGAAGASASTSSSSVAWTSKRKPLHRVSGSTEGTVSIRSLGGKGKRMGAQTQAERGQTAS
jgi:hypothetical protein